MWIVFALLAALSAAIVTILSKAGIKKLDPSLAFAIQSVLIIIVSWVAVFVQKTSHEVKQIDGRTWVYLIAAGIITAFSSLFTFQALKLGNASMVSPLERISLVFTILLAGFFLKEKITLQIIIGAVLMIAGAIVIATVKKES
ncbi:MAG TPA: EamA family transporter [Flavisolibacter sp.]|jgi:transporter family protein|nr:EamA family transporter [Flavisolibacter sp.]